MRRLSALIMLLGAVAAALGVAAVVGIERIDLPPAAVRVIAAALPYVVLVTGVMLLLLGTFMARLATREAERARSAVGAPTGAPPLGAGAAGDVGRRSAAGETARTAAGSERAT